MSHPRETRESKTDKIREGILFCSEKNNELKEHVTPDKFKLLHDIHSERAEKKEKLIDKCIAKATTNVKKVQEVLAKINPADFKEVPDFKSQIEFAKSKIEDFKTQAFLFDDTNKAINLLLKIKSPLLPTHIALLFQQPIYGKIIFELDRLKMLNEENLTRLFSIELVIGPVQKEEGESKKKKSTEGVDTAVALLKKEKMLTVPNMKIILDHPEQMNALLEIFFNFRDEFIRFTSKTTTFDDLFNAPFYPKQEIDDALDLLLQSTQKINLEGAKEHLREFKPTKLFNAKLREFLREVFIRTNKLKESFKKISMTSPVIGKMIQNSIYEAVQHLIAAPKEFDLERSLPQYLEKLPTGEVFDNYKKNIAHFLERFMKHVKAGVGLQLRKEHLPALFHMQLDTTPVGTHPMSTLEFFIKYNSTRSLINPLTQEFVDGSGGADEQKIIEQDTENFIFKSQENFDLVLRLVDNLAAIIKETIGPYRRHLYEDGLLKVLEDKQSEIAKTAMGVFELADRTKKKGFKDEKHTAATKFFASGKYPHVLKNIAEFAGYKSKKMKPTIETDSPEESDRKQHSPKKGGK